MSLMKSLRALAPGAVVLSAAIALGILAIGTEAHAGFGCNDTARSNAYPELCKCSPPNSAGVMRFELEQSKTAIAQFLKNLPDGVPGIETFPSKQGMDRQEEAIRRALREPHDKIFRRAGGMSGIFCTAPGAFSGWGPAAQCVFAQLPNDAADDQACHQYVAQALNKVQSINHHLARVYAVGSKVKKAGMDTKGWQPTGLTVATEDETKNLQHVLKMADGTAPTGTPQEKMRKVIAERFWHQALLRLFGNLKEPDGGKTAFERITGIKPQGKFEFQGQLRGYFTRTIPQGKPTDPPVSQWRAYRWSGLNPRVGPCLLYNEDEKILPYADGSYGPNKCGEGNKWNNPLEPEMHDVNENMSDAPFGLGKAIIRSYWLAETIKKHIIQEGKMPGVQILGPAIAACQEQRTYIEASRQITADRLANLHKLLNKGQEKEVKFAECGENLPSNDGSTANIQGAQDPGGKSVQELKGIQAAYCYATANQMITALIEVPALATCYFENASMYVIDKTTEEFRDYEASLGDQIKGLGELDFKAQACLMPRPASRDAGSPPIGAGASAWMLAGFIASALRRRRRQGETSAARSTGFLFTTLMLIGVSACSPPAPQEIKCNDKKLGGGEWDTICDRKCDDRKKALDTEVSTINEMIEALKADNSDGSRTQRIAALESQIKSQKDSFQDAKKACARNSFTMAEEHWSEAKDQAEITCLCSNSNAADQGGTGDTGSQNNFIINDNNGDDLSNPGAGRSSVTSDTPIDTGNSGNQSAATGGSGGVGSTGGSGSGSSGSGVSPQNALTGKPGTTANGKSKYTAAGFGDDASKSAGQALLGYEGFGKNSANGGVGANGAFGADGSKPNGSGADASDTYKGGGSQNASVRGADGMGGMAAALNALNGGAGALNGANGSLEFGQKDKEGSRDPASDAGTMGSEDPQDYLTKIPVSGNLFEIVSRRITIKEKERMLAEPNRSRTAP